MEKIFNHKSFNYFFRHLWEVELTYRYIFAFKFTLRSQQPVIDTGGKFAAGVVDPGDKVNAGIVDTGGKFATSVNNTSKICRWCC
jgi:hypothetical protein